jgi:hypothetical protein
MEVNRGKYKAEGRCFKCHEKGHIARNCPSSTGTATSKPPPYSQARQTNLDGWSQEQKKAMFELLMKEKEGKNSAAPTASSATNTTQDFRDNQE